MGAQMPQVNVTLDSTRYDESLSDLFCLVRAGDLPLNLLSEIAGLLDRARDMMDVRQTNSRTTADTIETLVAVYPSDRFNNLMAAIRARDWDLKGIKNIGHEPFPQSREMSFTQTSR